MVSQGGDSDVLGLARDGERLAVALLFIRGGSPDRQPPFCTAPANWTTPKRCRPSSSATTMANGASRRRCCCRCEMEDQTALVEEWLSELKGRKVRLAASPAGRSSRTGGTGRHECPGRPAGEKRRTTGYRQRDPAGATAQAGPASACRAGSNATTSPPSRAATRWAAASPFWTARRTRPATAATGSRPLPGQDDFAMLQEVFRRRFSPQRIEQWGLPDLVVVDGGIGQLNSTLAIIEELGLSGQFAWFPWPRAGSRGTARMSTVERSEERVFLPGRRNPVKLRQNSAPLCCWPPSATRPTASPSSTTAPCVSVRLLRSGCGTFPASGHAASASC